MYKEKLISVLGFLFNIIIIAICIMLIYIAVYVAIGWLGIITFEFEMAALTMIVHIIKYLIVFLILTFLIALIVKR